MEGKLNDLLHALKSAHEAVVPHLGRGSALQVDAAATDALRTGFNALPWGMRVAIGEGRNDNMPGLFRDELLGTGPFLHEIAVDPVDGTTPAAKRGMQQPWEQGQVVSAIALAPVGTIYYPPGPEQRMERIAVPGKVEGLSMDAPPADNLERITAVLGCKREELTAIVVSPHRNRDLIAELQRLGLRIMTPQCNLGMDLAALGGKMTGPHIIWGVAGGPETVIVAAAVRAVGGTLLARLWCLDEEERAAFAAVGTDITRVYRECEIVRERCGVVAVGVTSGPISEEGLILLEA